MVEISLKQLAFIVKSHQHDGSNTEKLRNQDFNLIAQSFLPVAATSLILDNIPNRRFLKVLIEHGAKSGNGNNLLRFNNDSGNNYTSVENGNGTDRTSASSIDLIDADNDSLGYFYIIEITNIQNLVKPVHAEVVARITSAATAQTRHRVYGTWVNTTEQISRIDLVASANNLPVNTIMSVFGSKE